MLSQPVYRQRDEAHRDMAQSRAGLEITFQFMGLELVSEVLPSPFCSPDPPVPLPTACCPAPEPLLHLISLWVWDTKSFKSAGTSQRVKWKKAHSECNHSWHTSLPDTQTLRGHIESGRKKKPLKLQKWASEVSERWFSTLFGLFTELNKGFLGMASIF